MVIINCRNKKYIENILLINCRNMKLIKPYGNDVINGNI